MGEDIEGALVSTAGGAALDGPDIDDADDSCAESRFLFRAPAGESVSFLEGASGRRRDCEGELRVDGSRSVLSVRFDIELQLTQESVSGV